MAVRGTADGKERDWRWTFSSRYVKDIPAERPRIRNTLMYAVTPSFQAGLEFNALKEELGPLVNWRAVAEEGWRPALILGTSSDRIGTPHGQAFYATLSKNLEPETGLPVAPYIGASYGTFEDELDPIAGGNVYWTRRFWTTHLYDGKNVHHILNAQVTDRLTAGILYVTQKDDPGDPYWGLTWGFRF